MKSELDLAIDEETRMTIIFFNRVVGKKDGDK